MFTEKQTHVVEVVYEEMSVGTADNPNLPSEHKLARKIEDAYGRLNATALLNNMVILATFQQAVMNGRWVCVIITVQWVNRADLQEARMRDMISGQMPGGKV